MIMYIRNEDICFTNADIIVNASNGIGYMGGKKGILKRKKGVAESIHFLTNGEIQKEVKVKVNLLRPQKKGTCFVTSAGCLHAKYIIHAITMKYPGSFTSYSIIEKLIPEIISKCIELNCNSIAIPLLGTGTGGLRKDRVKSIIESSFAANKDLEVYLYDL